MLRMACLAAVLLLALAAPAALAQQPTALRVCADPDNWPMSRRDGAGFENRIARVLAQEMKVPLQVHWVPLQGRVVKATLGARVCDVLMGVPEGFARTATSKPYYRSSFVWVQPAGATPLTGFSDARLAGMRVGLPSVRRDPTATPPGLALQESGTGARLVAFPAEDGRVADRLFAALAERSIEAVVLWGPQAGWYVKRPGVRLQMVPVRLPPDLSRLPAEVSISLAVRPGDSVLLRALDHAVERSRGRIDAILHDFGVPRVDG